MRALITGATGYIGLAVAAKLVAAGYEVHALVRCSSSTDRLEALVPSVVLHRFSKVENSIASCIRAAMPDITFHLATNFGGDIRSSIEANIVLGAEVCNALVLSERLNFVNTSTYWEYDAQGAFRPNTFYAASKRAFQNLIDFYAINNGLNATTLVLYDVYGTGDWRSKLLPQLAKSIIEGVPVDLTPGNQIVSMVDVRDVAHGFVLVGQMLLSGEICERTMGLASHERPTLREAVSMMCQLAGKPDRNRWGAKSYPKHQVMMPFFGLPSVPGWVAQIDLQAGLAALLHEAMAQSVVGG